MLKFGDEKGQLKCSFCGKTQEQVRKFRMVEADDRIGAFVVAQVTVPLADPHLEIIGIGAVHQHLPVVIGLDDDHMGVGRIGEGVCGHPAQVRHDDEIQTGDADPVPDRLRRVVGYDEIAGLQDTGDDLIPDIRGQGTTYGGEMLQRISMTGHRSMQLLRRPDRQFEIFAVGAEAADMVHVIVRDQDRPETVEGDPLVLQFPLDGTQAHAGIYEHGIRVNPVFFYTQEITVAAAAAGEGLELNASHPRNTW